MEHPELKTIEALMVGMVEIERVVKRCRMTVSQSLNLSVHCGL